MAINQLAINHLTEPLGYQLDNHLHVTFDVSSSEPPQDAQKKITVTADTVVYESAWEKYSNNFFDFEINLIPRTRYAVTVSIKNAATERSKTSFFETGKMDEPFTASWIGNPDHHLQNTLLKKEFRLHKKIAQARLYMTGLGVYETYLNSKKISAEVLAPGITAYDQLTQVQTYDVTNFLHPATNQELLISLGDGWYKGNFGFEGGQENIYGNRQMALAELHLHYTDGSEEIIVSDNSWLTTAGKITHSAIYYGEDYDDSSEPANWQPAIKLDYSKSILQDRLSLPLEVKEYLPVKKIIYTPAGETVLDFGQNHAGWPELFNQEPTGTTIKLQVGEILQNGNFYRDNLRAARAAFHYTSGGKSKWVRPHFTYFGYRYVKVTGNTKPLNKRDFRAAVIYSDMAVTGSIKTDNEKVNRLLQNIVWGQKSNFFDIPTDCPQRDERLGWSGDAAVFVGTAVLNMDCYAFFKKYAQDMKIEQETHQGMLPMYAPAFGNDSGGAAIWGDAATVIPWTVYQAYNDPAILRQNYSNMKAWVNWISQASSTRDLWTGCFQFGDWLSLDGENPAIPTGKTDEDFIASVYYYYSSLIVARAAKVLGFQNEAQHYSDQAQRVKEAIANEYITTTGRLAIDTQTAYALALHFNLVSKEHKNRVVKDLVNRLRKDNNHLKTGFVGTPIICQVLSENGEHKLAMQIFLNKDFPSWLYAVDLGATTIWERWNSVLPDGSMNPEGMNSLNHYSIGAVMQWVYQQVLGLAAQKNGYQQVTFAPQFDYRLKHVQGHYKSSYGNLEVDYRLETDKNHTIKIELNIPFGQEVTVKLPRVANTVVVNGAAKSLPLKLVSGRYTITYRPHTSYLEYYNLAMSVNQIMADQELVTKLQAISGVFTFLKRPENLKTFGSNSLLELNETLPFINISAEEFAEIKSIMAKTPLASERKFLHERRTF
nr:family 78 glycoside hydrolase catalytic domain [Lactobacillus xylocopicola]